MGTRPPITGTTLSIKSIWRLSPAIHFTLLNRLYGVWQCDLFTWYFRFQNTCNRNKFVWISRWISGFYITKSCKERHWTPFYPPNTLRGREYHFPVVRMFLREFSHKQCAETSVHKTTHPAVTKMTIVNFLVNVLQHKAIVMFFSFLRQMKIRKPTSQQGKKTNRKFKQNQYRSCEPIQVMHFIQEK